MHWNQLVFHTSNIPRTVMLSDQVEINKSTPPVQGQLVEVEPIGNYLV